MKTTTISHSNQTQPRSPVKLASKHSKTFLPLSLLFSFFILHSSLFICNCEQPSSNPALPLPAYAAITNGIISGYKNISVQQKDFTITIANETLRTPIAEDADLSSWFTNLPVGLSVRSKALVPISQPNINISITGTPLEVSDAQFAVTIPEGTLGEWKALPVKANSGAKYSIAIPDATVADVAITGLPGTPIGATDIIITLYKGTFTSTANAPSWISNMPQGLTAALKSSSSDTATITVSGTTSSIIHTPIKITLPPSAVSESPITVIENPKATFEIFNPDTKLAFINDITISGVKNFDLSIGLASPQYRWSRIKEITPAEIVIKLNRDSFHDITGISGWITNLPLGLTATLVSSSSDTVVINISGYPEVLRDAPVRVTIPASVLTGGAPLTAFENPNAVFHIPDVSITLPQTPSDSSQSRASIIGTKGIPITTVDTVQLSIANDTLKDSDIVGTDVTLWFTNIPAGLIAEINDVSLVAGKPVITITISGTPTERKVEHIKVIVPASFLKCNVDVEADPEISAKYVIAESAMTDAEMKTMVPITGGRVNFQPPYTYIGQDSSKGFPREPGPFYGSRIDITIPDFQIGKYEVTQQLWGEVYNWAIAHEYDFGAYSWTVPSEDKKYFPKQHISCKEAVMWCNAYSEMTDREPVYFCPDVSTVFKSIEAGGASLVYAEIHVKEDADGFRVPTPEIWEYAARGGDINGAAWYYRYPGTNNLAEVSRFAWVDKIRTYDAYNNEVRVGLFEPTAPGLYDMAGNLHEWTVKADSADPSQTITRGGANNRDANYCAFDWVDRTERRWSASRDIIGFRVVTMNND
jgi:formylglycine-generating enzyme required for sulfatase activity